MHSYVYQTLSLTTITVLSLATSNGLNANAGDVVQVQSLMNSPPGSQGQLDDPNIGFDMKNEIEGWGGVADTNNARTGQPFLAESNDHGCARTNKRRRGNTDYCSPKDAPLQFRPSSQQEDPQPGSSTVKTDGSATGPGQQPNPNTQTDGENLLAPDDNKKNNCPARYKIPICATSKLEPDPAQEGGWRREPWDEIAAADVIFQQDFCRLWYPHDRCDAELGIERFMCCRSVKPIVLDAEISIIPEYWIHVLTSSRTFGAGSIGVKNFHAGDGYQAFIGRLAVRIHVQIQEAWARLGSFLD